jgi:hypothetical protein
MIERIRANTRHLSLVMMSKKAQLLAKDDHSGDDEDDYENE